MMAAVTFYGHFSGHSSYPTVCREIAKYLHGRGVDIELCDLRPSGAYSGLDEVPRVDDSVRQRIMLAQAWGVWPWVIEGRWMDNTGLVFAFPDWLRHIPRHDRMIGYHVCDVDVIPPRWTTEMNKGLDEVVAPSQWVKNVFAANGVTRPIHVVNHGVNKAFRPSTLPRGGTDPIRLLHFCSARVDPSRKGTLELIEAVEQVHASKLVERGIKLIIHSNSEAVLKRVTAGPHRGIIEVWSEDYRSPEGMCALLHRHDLLVAPSRAEGFGMIPLEARAAGLPVIAAMCTGHADHLCGGDTDGAVIGIPTGGLARCGELGRAPSLEVPPIVDAIVKAARNINELTMRARETAAQIAEQWAWDRVLAPLHALLC